MGNNRYQKTRPFLSKVLTGKDLQLTTTPEGVLSPNAPQEWQWQLTSWLSNHVQIFQ